MRVFERLRDWWRGVPSEVTYDELVTAYEWVLEPVRIEIDPSTCPPHTTLFVPAEVSDTLRKLGAR